MHIVLNHLAYEICSLSWLPYGRCCGHRKRDQITTQLSLDPYLPLTLFYFPLNEDQYALWASLRSSSFSPEKSHKIQNSKFLFLNQIVLYFLFNLYWWLLTWESIRFFLCHPYASSINKPFPFHFTSQWPSVGLFSQG